MVKEKGRNRREGKGKKKPEKEAFGNFDELNLYCSKNEKYPMSFCYKRFHFYFKL
jgi:hypothetical protein